MRFPFRQIGKFLLIGFGLFFLATSLYVIWLRFVPPLTTPLMVMRAMEAQPAKNGEPFSFDCRWKSLDEISPQLQVAVIASEDQRFAYHFGVDWKATWEAAKYNYGHKRTRGGSTISQQVAKNVFLWPGRSYARKILELYFTLLIELFWSKERILEMYLNVAETGNGLFGAEAAARHYWGIPSSEITKQQASLLAACIPNPRIYSAAKPSAYIAGKAKRIRRFMGMIKGENYLKKL